MTALEQQREDQALGAALRRIVAALPLEIGDPIVAHIALEGGAQTDDRHRVEAFRSDTDTTIGYGADYIEAAEDLAATLEAERGN